MALAFKIIEDQRITHEGGIRKTSIDGLSQLWNILKGDMSIPCLALLCEAEQDGDYECQR